VLILNAQPHDDASRQQVEEFVQVLTREQRRLFFYIFGLVPNWGEAEEVLQNTNLVLWRKCEEFRPGSDFFRWACSVAHLEVLKWRDRRVRDSRVFSTEFIDEIGAELVQQGELIEARQRALSGCLGKLSDRDYRVIMLRYSDGATTKSVADELGRPIKSIYAAVNRIRDRLLECINRALSLEGVRPTPATEELP
jgi:RNA polymerase sigma-70 factor (ECF subfamily)